MNQQTARFKTIPLWMAAGILIVTSGCIAQRGRDFGSFAGRPEDIPVIRVYNVQEGNYPGPSQTMLLLPPLGEISPAFRDSLQLDIQEEFQNYFNARITSINAEGKMAEYVAAKNLAPEAGFFDFAEIGRLCELMQTEYAICTWVQELRPYPPQVLTVYMTILDVKQKKLIAELDATFNASEQKVVIALQDYLQRRRARKFNRSNLDFMLQSPSEFQRFAISECCHTLALELAPRQKVKLWP